MSDNSTYYELKLYAMEDNSNAQKYMMIYSIIFKNA